MSEKKPGDSGAHRIAFDDAGDPVTPERAVHDARNAQFKADLRLGTVSRALRACIDATRAAVEDPETRMDADARVRVTDALTRAEGILNRYMVPDGRPKE